MTETRLRVLRTLGCIIVLVAVYAFIFINLNLNLTGLVPSPISTTFENLKTVYRGISNTGQTNGNNLTRGKERTLTDVFNNLKKTNLKSGTTVTYSNHTSFAMDILWFNKPAWINVSKENSILKSQCAYSCRMSTNKTDIQNVSAVIFSLTEGLGFMPPVSRKDRNPDQAWIFSYKESPVHHFRMEYRHENWRNTMNWSMSYNLDADIFQPYGYLETKSEVTHKNYSSVFLRKTKLAVWGVSHCGARSKRDDFVSELASHGVQIDIFGECSTDKHHYDSKEFKALINKEYKFYLSFENSFCKDYVTEKFFAYYNLDVVLIVRGGLNYDKTLPNETFINSAHFNSSKDLASFILAVGNSEDSYTSYLRKKDRYVSHTDPVTYLCSICEKLHNVNENRKTFEDHVTYIHKETCWAPTDIPTNTVPWFILGSVLISTFCVCLVVTVWKWEKLTVLHKLWFAL